MSTWKWKYKTFIRRCWHIRFYSLSFSYFTLYFTFQEYKYRYWIKILKTLNILHIKKYLCKISQINFFRQYSLKTTVFFIFSKEWLIYSLINNIYIILKTHVLFYFVFWLNNTWHPLNLSKSVLICMSIVWKYNG